MKNIFQYFAAVMAGIVLLTACETDNESATYQGNGGVSFNAPSYIVSVPAANNTFELPINRDNASATQTVTISVGSDFYPAKEGDVDMSAIFTVPNSVTFQPGEYETTITIGVITSELAPGKSYDFTVNTSDTSVGGESKTKVQCSVVPNWVPVGTGTYTHDGFFFEGTDPMTLEQAEGSSFYRLPIFDTSSYVQFSIDEDGIINAAAQRAGFNYADYGAVSVTSVNGKSTWKGDVLSFYFTYTVSAGSFGETSDPGVFVLD